MILLMLPHAPSTRLLGSTIVCASLTNKTLVAEGQSRLYIIGARADSGRAQGLLTLGSGKTSSCSGLETKTEPARGKN